ncbi:MAG: TlpA disulfide reductase family protein [Bacteroidota bacterium]
MKNCYLTFALIAFLTPLTIAQSSMLEVGKAAPEINITHWLHNVPKDKTLEGKFIVLEFWATWCGPCIQAIPHINELQASVKDREDVIFLSMTYETPEKASKAIKRYDFQTAVVTDVTNLTQDTFAADAIPKTVLIDKAGKISWMGIPTELTEEKLQQFLEGRAIEEEEAEPKSEQRASRMSEYFGYVKSKENVFEIEAIGEYEGASAMAMSKGTYSIGSSFKELLANLLDVSYLLVEVPKEMESGKYELIYYNGAHKTNDEKDKALLDKILKKYGLQVEKQMQEVTVYQILGGNEQKMTKGVGKTSRTSTTDDEVIFTNKPLSSISTNMSDYMGLLVENKTQLEGRYDMTLNYKDLKAFKKDLKQND